MELMANTSREIAVAPGGYVHALESPLAIAHVENLYKASKLMRATPFTFSDVHGLSLVSGRPTA